MTVLGAGVGVLVAFLAVCWFQPYWLLRAFLWLVTHSIYRVRTLGKENVPATGGALLVCNHISYIDWLLVLAAQRRFVRFVIFAGYAKKWGLRHLLRWAGVIPIDGAGGPRAIVKSLRQASDALAAGELVCIFAEGRFTRTGFMLPFHRGFEQIVKNASVPIIPVCLDQVWGSVFSYFRGRIVWKLPNEIPYRVTVAFGKALPPQTKAADVRQAIQSLTADCAIARTDRRKPVHRQFVRMAARHPFRPCLADSITKGGDLNYGKTLAGSVCLARALRPLLGDEAMVAIWLPPGIAGALTNIAVALLGKTSVNLNYSSSMGVVQSALRQCGSKHVLTVARFTHRVKLDPGPGVELIDLEEILKHKITKFQKLRAYLGAILLPGFVLERWVLGLRRHRLDDLATVIFSSGTTGEPKGVMLTHGNVAANAESMIQAAAVTQRDRLLGVLPLFHSFGFTVTLWAPLQVGASSVFHADPRQAKEIGELCRSHCCTVYLSTATFLRFCLRKCDPKDFESVRMLVCGAEKLPQSLAQDFKEKFGVLPLEGYGCTELSPAVSVNTPDVDLDGYHQIGNKPGSIGQPVPGVAAKIVHPETMEPLPVGEEGLLLIHGANVMKGYLGKPELTAQVVRDGWYVTGDVGRIDEDGFITLTGRLSRFAKVGGEMVPLERVEEVMHEALGTSERICAVTCVPDDSRGERLVVLYQTIKLTEMSLEVQTWLGKVQGRGLPNLWVPSPRDFYPVPELPLLGSGKLDLKRVKDMAEEIVNGKS
jgi:acyl-[acyl-carrier-protein]-phospholipid O-acyltransferase/long-chain-fatty-acid--[acyl-carrier-protein] ligase